MEAREIQELRGEISDLATAVEGLGWERIDEDRQTYEKKLAGIEWEERWLGHLL
jgi:hypothetical protein